MKTTRIYALYWKEEILTSKRLNQLREETGWIKKTWSEPKNLKKVYNTIGHAKSAIKQLPEYMQPEIEIMSFIPEQVVYPDNKHTLQYMDQEEIDEFEKENIECNRIRFYSEDGIPLASADPIRWTISRNYPVYDLEGGMYISNRVEIDIETTNIEGTPYFNFLDEYNGRIVAKYEPQIKGETGVEFKGVSMSWQNGKDKITAISYKPIHK